MEKRKRIDKASQFLMLSRTMLYSKAFLSLTHSAAKALPLFLDKPKKDYKHPDHYTIVFAFTYGEAKEYGFSSSTFSKVIQELISKGFLDPDRKGGLRGSGGTCNFFKLSRRWMAYRTDKFQPVEWKCFYPRKKSA